MIYDSLVKQIESDIADLENLSPDSDEYKNRIDNIAKLHKLSVDELKSSLDYEDRRLKIDNTDDRNKKDDIDKLITHCIDVAGIVLPICFYTIWMRRGLEYEKDGAFTSTTFRNLISKFRIGK